MINDIHFPEQLSPLELDEYLRKGWYRMGQVIFTTNYIVYEELLYRVYWLRYFIPAIQPDKRHAAIIKAAAQFSVDIKPLQITDELETLYCSYKEGIRFDPPESVNHFLNDGGASDIYDSHIIEIRDGATLIGAGIFDNGEKTIAGIMNFYHPAYKKYSLGKYLMLLKLQHAKDAGKEWYYPGYIVEGNPRFDYKLFISKSVAEIYLPEFSSWVKFMESDLGRES